MKFRIMMCITAMTLFAALALPDQLGAQHTRYKLIEIGTLGPDAPASANASRCGIPYAPDFADDGQVNQDLLNPPLLTNVCNAAGNCVDIGWVCKLTESGPFCQANVPLPDGGNTDGAILEDGNTPGPCGPHADKQVFSNMSKWILAQRSYNNDYNIVSRHVARFGTRDFYLNSKGVGTTVHEVEDNCQVKTYGTPGDGDTVTIHITGTEVHETRESTPLVVNVNEGEIYEYPDGSFSIVSGEWDYVIDFNAGAHRFCNALGAPLR